MLSMLKSLRALAAIIGSMAVMGVCGVALLFLLGSSDYQEDFSRMFSKLFLPLIIVSGISFAAVYLIGKTVDKHDVTTRVENPSSDFIPDYFSHTRRNRVPTPIGETTRKKKNVALAVVKNQSGVAIFAPGLSTGMEDGVNSSMVRSWISKDLERCPQNRAKAAAIEEIFIVSDEDITYEGMKDCYRKHLLANNWAVPDGLRIFETFLGPISVYIAYGT